MTALTDYDKDACSTWQELDNAVKANGGVLRAWMWQLREIAGKSRLKTRVVAGIHEELINRGIDHLPADLPGDQNQYVVLFKIGTEAGAVIAAVRNGSSTEAAEAALRRLNTSKALQADREKDAKLAELATKIEEMQLVLDSFREILDDEQ